MSSGMLGRYLLGRYRIDQHIASTNMSDVFLVWDMKRNVNLIMKVLDNDDPAMLRLFRREAQALKKLNHPNIVPFYGLYQEDDLNFFLEMFIDGPNLKDILRRIPDHKLKIEEVLIFIKGICSALGYAHANGIIHCDIKPGNVMVDRGGTVYLVDFGIARHANSNTTMMAGAGTAKYMAPEQITNEVVSASTDVYSLGIMIFEMLAGKHPFRSESGQFRTNGNYLHNSTLNLPPPNLHDLAPELPISLTKVVMKAINKIPGDRYSSIPVFFSAICQALNITADLIPDRYQADAAHYSSSPTNTTPILTKPLFHFLMKYKIRIGIAFLSTILLSVIFLVGLKLGLPAQIFKLEGELTSTSNGQLQQSITGAATFDKLSFTKTGVQLPTTSSVKYEDIAISKKDNQIMIRIPEGEFLMGLSQNQIEDICKIDPSCKRTSLIHSMPTHKVFLSDYYIYKHEVTNAQYALCVKENVCTQPHKYNSNIYDDYYINPIYKNYPVVFVDWYQADQYCQWTGGRLPTEAEWEKAARGTQGYIWPWGNDTPADHLANLSSTNLTTIDNTTEVGFFPDGQSPYGIMDMAGNVYEWVADWYSATYYHEGSSITYDPTGPENNGSLKFKVVRGGSSAFGSWVAVSGFHDYEDPSVSGHALGFRCVQKIP